MNANISDWSDLETPSDFDATKQSKPTMAKIDVASGISLGAGRSVEKQINQVAMFKCNHCNGSGRFVRGFVNVRDYGPCHRCKGTGKLKTDPQRLAARRQAQAAAKAERFVEYRDAHKAEWEWAQARAQRFDFARSMCDALTQYGSWTDGQLAAIRKLIAQDAQRDAERAKARAEAEASAPQMAGAGFDRMVNAFRTAKESGLKYPKFTVGEMVFSLAGAKSKYNGNALFVKSNGTYIGRIDLTAQRFIAVSACTSQDNARVEDICKDPLAAAVMHGKQTGSCSCCGRELENEESVSLGIGPICRRKWGL